MNTGKKTPPKTTESETKKGEAGASASSETLPLDVPKHETDAIIRKRVYAAMVVGLAPIPLLDLAGITAIQVEMVRALAKRYEVPFKAEAVKAIISSLAGGALPVAFAPATASLLKFIPVIGWTSAGVSLSLLGGAVTYALGRVFTQHFASGGVLLDFNVEKFRGVFQSKVQEGQTVASEMKEEQQASA